DQPALVHPLSLIELQEDYQFQSTPDEANRLIKKRRDSLETLIASLEPLQPRPHIYPIVSIANDVAKETIQMAIADQANLILVGWHRSGFSDNRLGGRVGKILNNAPIDVAVLVDKRRGQWQSLLLAYADNIHDDLGFSLALRLLFHQPDRTLTVLRLQNRMSPELGEDSSFEFRQILDRLPQTVRSRIDIITLEATDPIKQVVEASRRVDLTLAGTSRTWGIEKQTLGRYTDELAQDCHSSLLITRRYSQVMSHVIDFLAPEESHNDHL
ncbi:MAG: universal stress protein, partial [Microcystaceae cyanobacterium]